MPDLNEASTDGEHVGFNNSDDYDERDDSPIRGDDKGKSQKLNRFYEDLSNEFCIGEFSGIWTPNFRGK